MASFTETFEWTQDHASRKQGILRGLVGTVLKEIQLRRALRNVGSLDDAALLDMGISRGGIEDAVRHGRS